MTTTETSPRFVSSCLETTKEKVRNSQNSITEFSVLRLLSQFCSQYDVFEFFMTCVFLVFFFLQPASKRPISTKYTYTAANSKIQKVEYSNNKEKPVSTRINKTTKEIKRKMKQPQAYNEGGKLDPAPELSPTITSTSKCLV